MLFQSIEELLELTKKYGTIAEVMIQTEIKTSQYPREIILEHMSKNLSVMMASIKKGVAGVTSVTGLTGGDAKRMDHYLENSNYLSGTTILKAVRNAVAVNEVNAEMGLICATPTAGSAGVAAGVLSAMVEDYDISHEEQLNFLFTAGAIGLVIANKASISGAAGGCQAEIGSASAMASGALVILRGGTPQQAAQAVAMTIANMLGLICDPVAGLVEVPCVKRNALGASQAFISADMALAGINSVIPVDEVIETMHQVGMQMPSIFKETAEGGLAATKTGKEIMHRLYQNNK
ncbi:L-serine ammonia-lyase, iron-sulfur-dependent, subunit alpha [Vagococcus vulneris]|uniref:L-serine dehydratase n=1 Tax=Vagococcus vulneris TaxID=1977869 RepID=A0A429ZVJ3_9ENTE|nr:L-serine ammonia-lyase, iron-sulfur-dependent, subunit alpha [Vagococcus vulneris]RST97682.1 L-serine ammonia-lyase, iron-sulfur-dependent, subunit alpha [Vagococcus vulneris]